MDSAHAVTVHHDLDQPIRGGSGKGKTKGKGGQSKGKPSGSGKLRGLDRDAPEVRISKTLSWLLRHGAQSEGLPIRKDGYVQVDALLEHPKLKTVSLNFGNIQEIVKADAKKRYDLRYEFQDGSAAAEGSDKVGGAWWIKANQGHSIKTVALNLTPITSVDDIPTGIAVHGTDRNAWKAIESQGLSKMKRNHIHLAQGISGQNVVSGMRKGASILIFIDVPKALDGGIKFHLSDNGVVLTEGDESGFLKPEFFARVENAKREPLPGWEGSGPVTGKPLESTSTKESSEKPTSQGYQTPNAPAVAEAEGSTSEPPPSLDSLKIE